MIINLKATGLSQLMAFKFIARCFFNVSQNCFPETYVPALPLSKCPHPYVL